MTGKLVDPEDVQVLTDQIFDMYANPQMRKSMGKAGHTHVMRCFTIERNANRFEKLYSWLLTDPDHLMNWRSNWSMKPVFSQAGKFVFNHSRKVVGMETVGR